MSNQRKRLPHQIDPFRLAESGAELEGSVPLKQFQRLQPLLSDDSGAVAVVLKFDIDDLGVPYVVGTLKTTLALTCQRCLEKYDFPVESELVLAWVKSDQESERLPLRYEPYLVDTNPLVLNDVIEDELLLALPQIPMHAEQECKASEWLEKEQENSEYSAENDNPFSVLEKLKSKD